ncbi:AAA family ATPase [Flavobacterium sp. MK4S-17]|uniref:AAA family ATPase n=1 Tax=Flavobacterium sp. MK4S-17 TaxID=2543737 RepID=UPI001359DD23|nr:AAA family ATPase [Flavobacterium sp. MK4S-17]
METIINNNFYVVTGGPGSGKTTLIKELKNMGYNCIDEAARKIIMEEVKNNGKALPWKNKLEYTELMLKQSVADYLHAERNNITFFDRGIPDTLCYSKIIKSTTKGVELAAQMYRYSKKVFILPPWPEIYTTDNERKQDWEEAVLTYKLMKETYTALGYKIIEVPKADIKNRCQFLLNQIKNPAK